MSSSVSSIRNYSQNLRRLPRVLAQKVTAAAAPVLTSLANGTFDASETPYGVDWAPGANGQRVTLDKSGSLKRTLKYTAIGTLLRVVLGVRYAKYQIGKRSVYPRQDGALPETYARALERVAVDVVRAQMQVSR